MVYPLHSLFIHVYNQERREGGRGGSYIHVHIDKTHAQCNPCQWTGRRKVEVRERERERNGVNTYAQWTTLMDSPM